MSLEELSKLEVTTVSRNPVEISQSPSATQIIASSQIEHSGANTIPELLRFASNLNIAQQNASEWIITSRGFSSDVGNKLLVMMDGRSVYTPLFSGVFWPRQDYILQDLQRIEVVSGPGATLWGSNAVNGVINIITKNARDTQGLYVKANTATQLKHSVAVRFGAQANNNTHYRVYGKQHSYKDGYHSDGTRSSDQWEKDQIGFRVDIEDDSTLNQFTLQGDYYELANAQPLADEVETSGGNILAKWKRETTGFDGFSLQFYYDYTQLKLPTPPTIINGTELSPEGVFEDELQTIDFDFQHNAQIKNHQIVWGVTYRNSRDTTKDSPGLAFYPNKVNQNLYSLFIQDEMNVFTDATTLTLGVKFEKNDYTDIEWGPSLRFKWAVNQDNLLWWAVSKAVRMPSRIDRDFSQPSKDYTVLLQGNSEFKSESVIAYELGYRALFDNKVSVNLATFYNEYDDIRSTSFTEETILPFYFENNLQGETYGVELSVAYEFSKLSVLRLGYNYLEQDMRVKPGAFDLNNAQNETSDPKHQALLEYSANFSNEYFLQSLLRWVDEVPTNNAGERTFVPSYTELDLSFTWRVDRYFDLSVFGRNLLNKSHQEFGIPGDKQEEATRNIGVGVKLFF